MIAFKKICFYTTICLLLSSCEFNCSVGKNKNEPDKSKTVSSSVTEKDGTILTNNISLTAKGVKVTKATLLLPDKSRVSDDNVVHLNENIKLYLFIAEGWKLRNGKVYLGASEKITTDAGDKVVDAEDLFAEQVNTGADPEDAKVINLSAVITKETEGIKYYNVNFRVWDRNSDASITGEYRFYIKH